MALGRAPTQEVLHGSTREFCESQLGERSIYRVLACESHRLFGDELFADLFVHNGRPSVPPRIVAVVMTLQRLEGLSDREAIDRFTYDLRWKYAAGCLDFTFPGFVHTVLVNTRARLRDIAAPNRIFERVLDVAKEAGLVGRKRVLDSTALYDAVATQDTVTLVRGAIVGVLRAVRTHESKALEIELRARLRRDDDDATSGKPACDWDDEAARDALVDALCQYTPVASIATCVQPSDSSQSRSSKSARVVVSNVRTSRATRASSRGWRMHATTVALCTSSPAQCARMMSIVNVEVEVMRGGERSFVGI